MVYNLVWHGKLALEIPVFFVLDGSHPVCTDARLMQNLRAKSQPCRLDNDWETSKFYGRLEVKINDGVGATFNFNILACYIPACNHGLQSGIYIPFSCIEGYHGYIETPNMATGQAVVLEANRSKVLINFTSVDHPKEYNRRIINLKSAGNNDDQGNPGNEPAEIGLKSTTEANKRVMGPTDDHIYTAEEVVGRSADPDSDEEMGPVLPPCRGCQPQSPPAVPTPIAIPRDFQSLAQLIRENSRVEVSPDGTIYLCVPLGLQLCYTGNTEN